MDIFDDAPSRRLLCPQERFEKDKDGKVTIISEQIHHIINSSYFISDAEDKKSNHLHSLICYNQDEHSIVHHYCSVCQQEIINKTYYYCSYCKTNYHKECVESPSEFHSSDHPKHHLQLLWLPLSSRKHKTKCWSCTSPHNQLFYYCSICDFSLHPVCAGKPTSLTIENPKRHKHTLHYFPRISPLVCDVCGLKDIKDYLYVCFLCDFIVHKRCVDLPYVIKVSRHDHRLAFTYTLPYNEESFDCGVCHAEINKNYGEYSCKKERCVYAVHSRCAMQSDVCDGKELEGEPEETSENTTMFEEIGDGIIQHSTHPGHRLRLENKFHDESKHCQACIRPSYGDGNVYRCLQCDDFILHESCAYIPRVKQFMLHIHPLTLELKYTTSWLKCRNCDRFFCGYAYVCRLSHRWDYMTTMWAFDTVCASIREPFHYHSHPHPLFITCGQDETKICSICQLEKERPLYCVKCDFVLCYRCATLPHKARYKYDEHFLIFSYEENINGKLYECEMCEEDINPTKGLYVCNECEVTFHIDCLLGRDPYMKSGQSLKEWFGTTHVLTNTCSTRPICNRCKRRCPYNLKIELYQEGRLYIYCSFNCYV